MWAGGESFTWFMGGSVSRFTSRPSSPAPLLETLPTSIDRLTPIRILPEPLPPHTHSTTPHPIPTAVHGSFYRPRGHLAEAASAWMRLVIGRGERVHAARETSAEAQAAIADKLRDRAAVHAGALSARDERMDDEQYYLHCTATVRGDSTALLLLVAILLHCYC